MNQVERKSHEPINLTHKAFLALALMFILIFPSGCTNPNPTAQKLWKALIEPIGRLIPNPPTLNWR
jgi:hypothetical protein